MPLEKIQPPADFGDRAANYAGKYKGWRHNQSTLEKAFVLLGSGVTVTPTSDNTLLISGLGPEPRQFVEIYKNLFRQIDGQQRIAFGEDENGNIRDFYIDGATFVALSRAPVVEGNLYTQLLPMVSFFIFITVWVGWIYRRKDFKTMMNDERMAIRMSMGMTGLNLLFVISMVIILSTYGNSIIFTIPAALRVALVLPDLASLVALGVVWFAVKCWKDGYWRQGRRIHYTLVALSGLFMAWFYYYWNFLGIQLD